MKPILKAREIETPGGMNSINLAWTVIKCLHVVPYGQEHFRINVTLWRLSSIYWKCTIWNERSYYRRFSYLQIRLITLKIKVFKILKWKFIYDNLMNLIPNVMDQHQSLFQTALEACMKRSLRNPDADWSMLYGEKFADSTSNK